MNVLQVLSTRDSNKRGIRYEIAWEYTELGESVIEGAKLVDAAIIGSQIQSIRRNNNGVSDKETPRHDQLRKQSKTAHIRQLLAKYSDEDSFGAAPGSNSDRSSDNDSTSTNMSNSQEEDKPSIGMDYIW
jgi:hypothetical protein